MMRSRLGHPYVLLVCAALFWALAAIVARHVAGEVPPMALNFWRWLLAFCIALPWTWREISARRALIRAHWKYMSFIAITSAVGFGALHFVAMQYTTAINGALFQGLMAMFIIVAAWLILGDRIGGRQAAGVGLGFAGLATIVGRGDVGVILGLSFNTGDMLLFVATACYAVYAAYLRRAPEGLSTGALMTVMFGLAAVYMLPLWLIEIYAFDRPLPLGFTSLWSIAYMAVFPSLLAQTFWASGVAQVGPGRAGYFIYLSPVFGVLLAIGLLGEVFRWYHAAGIVLIFAGLWLANSARRAPAAAEPEK